MLSDVYELPSRLDGRFDIVFASHGVLCWLPDLAGWARIVAAFLRPSYPYFQQAEPVPSHGTGSYAAPDAPMRSVTYQWPHPLSEVLNSLIAAGLRIDSFEEYPFAGWAVFPWMTERPDGLWELPADRRSLPLMFALKASKPDA